MNQSQGYPRDFGARGFPGELEAFDSRRAFIPSGGRFFPSGQTCGNLRDPVGITDFPTFDRVLDRGRDCGGQIAINNCGRCKKKKCCCPEDGLRLTERGRGRTGFRIVQDITIFEREIALRGKMRVVLQASTTTTAGAITTTQFSILASPFLNMIPGQGTVLTLGKLPSKNIIGGNISVGNFTLNLSLLNIIVDNSTLVADIVIVGSAEGNVQLEESGILTPAGIRPFYFNFRPTAITVFTM